MEDLSTDNRGLEQKPRKRMKDVRKMILKQMEFYFSDSNLQKDRFIKKEMEKSKDGYVDLSIFLKFNRVKTLTQDIKVVARALAKSKLLQVNEDGKSVRRITPLREPKDIDDRTVYIECLPRNVTHDWVKKIFSECGEVAYVSLPRYQTTGDSKGFGFVEFITKDGAVKASEQLNNPPESSARAGKFPKSNKTLSNLQKKTGVSVDAEENKVAATTDDTTHSKPCKKHRKRRRCASESSVDFVTEGLHIFKKKKVDSPEIKLEKKEFEQGLLTAGDVLVKKENKTKLEVNNYGEKVMVKKEFEQGLPTAGDVLVKKENKSKLEVKNYGEKTDLPLDGQNPDDEDKKEVKRKKRKCQRLSDSKLQEEDLKFADSIVDKGTDILKRQCSDSDQDNEKKGKKKKKYSEQSVETSPLKVEQSPVKGKGKRLSESKDALDSGVTQHKMVRIDTSANKEILEQVKAKQKKEKRKRKKKHKEKDIPLPQLRVMPKKEWLSLRKEYLSLQKESMAMLKQKLKEIKTVNTHNDEPGSITNSEHYNSEMASVKVGKKIEFQEGVIVHVTSTAPMNRKQIKEQLVPDIQVAYFDVLDAAVDGYIRCKNRESAIKLTHMNNAKYQFSMLSGDKEKGYWSKLAADQEAKLNTKNRSKKRGTQKLIDKAHRHNSETTERKHIMFED